MTRYWMAVLVWVMAAPGWAGDQPSAMLRFIDRDVMSWANDARLVGALMDPPLAVQFNRDIRPCTCCKGG